MKSRVIMLDIDGVCNCAYTKEKAPSGVIFVKDSLVQRVKTIVDETDADIVLTSTWRYGWRETEEKCNKDFIALRDKFREFGMEFADSTPRHSDAHRGREITAFLSQHPEVERYVVIDDDIFDLKEHKSRVVQTSWKEGLTEGAMRRAIKILKGEK